jgi:hypothetical protein
LGTLFLRVFPVSLVSSSIFSPFLQAVSSAKIVQGKPSSLHPSEAHQDQPANQENQPYIQCRLFFKFAGRSPSLRLSMQPSRIERQQITTPLGLRQRCPPAALNPFAVPVIYTKDPIAEKKIVKPPHERKNIKGMVNAQKWNIAPSRS